MNILIVCHYFLPHPGGIEVVAQNQAKQLVAAGHQVHILTSTCGGGKKGLEKHADGYHIYRVSANNLLETKLGVAFPLFSPAIFREAFTLAKQADIIHVHDAFYISSLAASLGARLHKKTLFLTQHVAMIPHPKKFVIFAQKLVYATSGRFIFGTSKKIIILNSRVKGFLLDQNIPESKIIFLPNGVDTKEFSPATSKQKLALRKKYNLPQGKTLALFVGRFAPKKGFTKLLKLQPIDNLHIVFAGGDAPAKHTRKDQHFLGTVSRKDAPDVFRVCDIFVLPSEGEGFPLTVQEAMASGLPVITTDDPAYGLYDFDRTSIELIKPTPRNIADALKKLAADTKKQTHMSRYGRAYAQTNIAWSVHIKKLIALYAEALV